MWEIRGDSENYKDCLLWVAGNTKEEAEKILEKILANPDKYQKEKLEQYTNIRVAEEKNPWYLDSKNFRD